MNLKPLNSKETKNFLKQIEAQFETTFSKDYIFFLSPKDRVYILTKDYQKIQDKKMKINNLGLYIATIEKDGVRLSIDGSQLLKPKKNVISITREQLDLWIAGRDLEIDNDDYGYFCVKYEKEFIGCGKLKNNILNNFIPKQRRIVTTK